MLITTYSLVAISTEQKNLRNALTSLQQNIQDGLHGLAIFNRRSIEPILRKLDKFEETCRQRKVEHYIIPAIRKATRQADPVLASLELLRFQGSEIFKSLQHQLRLALDCGKLEIKDFCSTMDRYCQNHLARLAIEEEELFPVAGRVFSTEEWFSIGAHFLSDDDTRVNSHTSHARAGAFGFV